MTCVLKGKRSERFTGGASQLFIVFFAIGLVFYSAFTACSEGGGVNIFSINDDIQLGRQLSEEVKANPAQYPLLDPAQYPKAYEHLHRITNNLLNSGKITNRDKFVWEIHIIHDDKTLNAFCAPGGFIYVYTGLIKFLDKENELAGVLGHEIAHADLRHSTDRLTTAYGVQLLIQLALGQDSDKAKLAEIAAGLALLAYSRANETQADKESVQYLCGTEYDARGTAGFFQKLIAQNQTGNVPAFLSTHPNPDNRVENILKTWTSLACQNNGTFESRYQDFKKALP